jgi:formylglycine-generating enzyme required for sulfatase activity
VESGVRNQRPGDEAGLFDMHGNSWEWTQNATLRGGSFINQPMLLRVDYRWSAGFRFDFSFAWRGFYRLAAISLSFAS